MAPRRRLLLVCLVALGALLRFYGISQGLAHLPVQSERIFVESVWGMVSAHDLNQRCFLYPGLFFYLLYLPIALVHTAGPPGETAYLVTRCVVAAFGVLNIPLTYRLGERLRSPRVGLAAAVLTAFSPLEVATCHWIRPDVVLESFVCSAFLVFYAKTKRDVASGVSVGAATAVKFTGVLLAPSYIVRRLSEGRVAWRGLLLAGGVSVVAFFFFTPYAVLTPQRFLEGANTQMEYQYAAHADSRPHWSAFLFYLRTVGEHLGPAGLLLLALGLLAAWSTLRFWSALLVYPPIVILAHTTATTVGTRFLVPAAPALSILAALGAEWLWARSPRIGAFLFGLAALYSLGLSADFDRRIAKPMPMDEARDWIGAHLPAGSLVLTGEKHLVIDRDRFALQWSDGSFWRGDPLSWSDRLMAVNSDLVVADPQDPLVAGFQEVYRASPAVADTSATLGLFVPPPGLKAVYQPVVLMGASLSASENGDLLGALVDEKRHTFWHTDSLEGPKTWIQVDLASPVCLGRVVVELRNHIGSPLRLLVEGGSGAWEEVPSVEIDETLSPPRQILLTEGILARRIRIVPATKSHTRWAVRKLELDATPSE